jgi:HK97 family phage major capsid protein
MATFSPNTGNTVTKANAGREFIPELWSDEIIAAYKNNLVLANLVNKMPMTGKKGDTMHIPKPTRGQANRKDAADTVTIQQTSNDEVLVNITEHFEYSRLIEDITEVQAMDSLRRFYTDDAGYQLAKQMDTDLHTLGKKLGDGDGTSYVHSASYQFNTSTGRAETYDADGTADVGEFNDAGFRDLIQFLDDADVPMDGRSLIIPPSARNTIMGIDRYQSSDFVDGRGVVNGQIGTLYGIDVYVSTNCPVMETGVKAGLLIHRDAFVLAEQMAVRSQTQYKQEYLATLFTSDCLYGLQTLRPEAGVVIALPA